MKFLGIIRLHKLLVYAISLNDLLPYQKNWKLFNILDIFVFCLMFNFQSFHSLCKPRKVMRLNDGVLIQRVVLNWPKSTSFGNVTLIITRQPQHDKNNKHFLRRSCHSLRLDLYSEVRDIFCCELDVVHVRQTRLSFSLPSNCSLNHLLIASFASHRPRRTARNFI